MEQELCREVSIRQILVSELCYMSEDGMPMDEFFKGAYKIASQLNQNGIKIPRSLHGTSSGSDLSADVTWEFSLLQTINAMVDNGDAVRRNGLANSYRTRMAYLFEDLEQDVKDKLFSSASALYPQCAEESEIKRFHREFNELSEEQRKEVKSLINS